MERRTRSNMIGGLMLVGLGILFLIYQIAPEQMRWLRIETTWPMIVIASGVGLLVLGLLVGAPGMAIPASIVSGVGLLLYWQNATGNWESWAYAWALIPGFAGVGIILNGMLGGERMSQALKAGFWLILISLTLFVIFASWLGGLNLFGPYWPVLLILLGLLVLVRNILRR